MTLIAGITAGKREPTQNPDPEEDPWEDAITKGGRMWNPMAIMKGTVDKFKDKPLPGCPKEMKHCMSVNGYLTEDLFDEDCADWIISEVNLSRGDTRRWHMLPMDGAGPHQFCWRALKKLWDARIIVPGMPSHTSTIFQMLDTHCFHGTKTRKRRKVREWKSDKGATQVGKWDFPGVGYECLIAGCTPDIIEHSFSDNGVWPYDSNWVFKNRHKFVTESAVSQD